MSSAEVVKCKEVEVDKELTFNEGVKAGQAGERARIKAIYEDANDLKELENRINEYLDI